MNNKLRNGIAISLIPQILLVMWLANHPQLVETYYSNGIYPVISQFFRIIFGWIPFSVGEILYTLLIVIGIRYLVKKRKEIKANPLRFLRNVAMVLSVFYFTFNLVWGLNYYREPIAEKFNIRDSIQPSQLIDITEKLILKTNELQFAITADSTQKVQVPYTRKEIFEKTKNGYAQLGTSLPFLSYSRPSLKKSLYSTASSYLGIGGYLNPFTNEAQVNANTPLFWFPVYSGHEVGHQVGYSKENETNFIGYLVTMKNEDLYFQYAACTYALNHCLGAVNRMDSAKFEELRTKINEGTLKNYQEMREYNEKYENPLEPIFESIFNTFLKANNQEDGIQSYSRVVNLLVGYHRQNPL